MLGLAGCRRLGVGLRAGCVPNAAERGQWARGSYGQSQLRRRASARPGRIAEQVGHRSSPPRRSRRRSPGRSGRPASPGERHLEVLGLRLPDRGWARGPRKKKPAQVRCLGVPGRALDDGHHIPHQVGDADLALPPGCLRRASLRSRQGLVPAFGLDRARPWPAQPRWRRAAKKKKEKERRDERGIALGPFARGVVDGVEHPPGALPRSALAILPAPADDPRRCSRSRRRGISRSASAGSKIPASRMAASPCAVDRAASGAETFVHPRRSMSAMAAGRSMTARTSAKASTLERPPSFGREATISWPSSRSGRARSIEPTRASGRRRAEEAGSSDLHSRPRRRPPRHDRGGPLPRARSRPGRPSSRRATGGPRAGSRSSRMVATADAGRPQSWPSATWDQP